MNTNSLYRTKEEKLVDKLKHICPNCRPDSGGCGGNHVPATRCYQTEKPNFSLRDRTAMTEMALNPPNPTEGAKAMSERFMKHQAEQQSPTFNNPAEAIAWLHEQKEQSQAAMDREADKAEGLAEDLHQLIRVCLTNPGDVRGFIEANYPKEYKAMGNRRVNELLDLGVSSSSAISVDESTAVKIMLAACEGHEDLEDCMHEAFRALQKIMGEESSRKNEAQETDALADGLSPSPANSSGYSVECEHEFIGHDAGVPYCSKCGVVKLKRREISGNKHSGSEENPVPDDIRNIVLEASKSVPRGTEHIESARVDAITKAIMPYFRTPDPVSSEVQVRCRFCGVTASKSHEYNCGHNPRGPKEEYVD